MDTYLSISGSPYLLPKMFTYSLAVDAFMRDLDQAISNERECRT